MQIAYCYLQRSNVGNVFIPYVWGVLRAYCDEIPELKTELHWSEPVSFFDETDPESIRKAVDAIKRPDFFLVTCYSWNTRIQLNAAALAKKRWPECTIVAGGPNVPDDCAEFFQDYPFVDILVHGEGEKPLSEIFLSRLRSTPLENIANISTRKRQCESRHRYTELPLFESPYLRGYFDAFISEARSRKLEPHMVWETHRGCPYSCTFCDWGSAVQTKIRPFPVDRMKAEIDWMAANKIQHIKNIDPNFGILPRDVEIAEYMCEVKKKNGYPGDLWLAWAKGSPRRVLLIGDMLNQQNLLKSGLSLSMQSTNEAELRAIKRKNIRLDDFQLKIDELNEKECPIYSELIAGLPLQTIATYKKSIYDLFEAGVHELIKVHPLEVLPNAEMFSKEYIDRYGIKTLRLPYQNRLGIYSDTRNIDFQHVVKETNTASVDDMVEMHAFYKMIRILHLCGMLRLVSIFVRREYGENYSVFYETLLAYFRQRPESQLAVIWNAILEETSRAFKSDDHQSPIHFENWRLEQILYNGRLEPVKGTLFMRKYLYAIAHRDAIYAEVGSYLKKTYKIKKELLDELLRFQNSMMIDSRYLAVRGKWIRFDYDFVRYFRYYKRSHQPLRKAPIKIRFLTSKTGTGVGQPIELDKATDFLRTVCGNGTMRPGYYMHRFEHMECRDVKRWSWFRPAGRYFDRMPAVFSRF